MLRTAGSTTWRPSSVDATSGKLTPTGWTPTQGKTPRNFAIDPNGAFLLAANQDSNSIVTFHINPTNGDLTLTGAVTDLASPVCLQILYKVRGQVNYLPLKQEVCN